METQQVNIMSYIEVEELFNKLIKNPTGDVLRLVAMEEWSNDTDYYFSNVIKGLLDHEYAKKYILPKIEEFLNSGRLPKDFWVSCSDILSYLCEKDVIPAGNYLVRVSW